MSTPRFQFQVAVQRFCSDFIFLGTVALLGSLFLFDNWVYRGAYSLLIALTGGGMTLWEGPTLTERYRALLARAKR